MHTIRPAIPDDVPAISAIYNHEVEHSLATMDSIPEDASYREKWLSAHGPEHPVLVADDGGEVAGWASLSRWSDKDGYDGIVELSVFVAEGHRRKGLGRELMKEVLALGEKAGHHTVASRITVENRVSIALHREFGFYDVGVQKGAGYKFGERHDVLIMQLDYR